MSSKRALAAVGDVHDINCWSNIPFHFFHAGLRAGFFDAGLSVDVAKLSAPRAIWNALSPLRGERFGGFQFTRVANSILARTVNWSNFNEVITHSQCFPPFEAMVASKVRFSHYIDFPLVNLFEDYGLEKVIGERTASEALVREREQYAGAERVVCMSPWARTQVIERCGTPAEKVHAIIPGANFPESLFEDVEPEPLMPPEGRLIPLRIAFVGKAPQRKGIDRLVEGVRILRSRGLHAYVRVIGPRTNPFPGEPSVEHLGFIDKRAEPERIVEELRSCHIGALPSYQEAFGIAALEYLRCGLPAIITRTGGLGDSLPADCRIMLEPTCSGLDIADSLEYLLRNPDVYCELQRNAQLKAKYASWDRCLNDFNRLWSKSED